MFLCHSNGIQFSFSKGNRVGNVGVAELVIENYSQNYQILGRIYNLSGFNIECELLK